MPLDVSEGIPRLCAVIAAVLDDPLHLLVNQLDTTQTGVLQAFDLPLHQQLKRNLGHEQSGPRPLSREIQTVTRPEDPA